MLSLNFSPFPLLTTERLVLRPLELSDDKELFSLRTSDEVNKYIGNPKPTSIEEVHTFIHKLQTAVANNESIFWVISLKDDPKLIGTFCFWNIDKENAIGEIGYTLLPAYWGKGYMQEVIQKAMEYGLQAMQLKAVEAYSHKDNIASLKLLGKNNFRFTPDKKAEENENFVVYTISC